MDESDEYLCMDDWLRRHELCAEPWPEGCRSQLQVPASVLRAQIQALTPMNITST